MFNEYKNNRVKNHSVGMIYVDLALAINDDDDYYKEEFAVWNKYINNIINRDEAEDLGYFFAIRQAKLVEGSAVPLGSNPITPTLTAGAKQYSGTGELGRESTHDDQPFDLSAAIKNTRFII
jgi:hypothetical protein